MGEQMWRVVGVFRAATLAYAAYHLIALRGLRRGEAAGLRWCDVDLDGKAAVISQQLQQYDGKLAVCRPKTRTAPG